MNDTQIIARAHQRLRDLSREINEITVFLTTMDRLTGPDSASAFTDEKAQRPAPAGEAAPASPAPNPVAKPAVEAVDGSAMSEGGAVAPSPKTADSGSRLDAGRTASATSEFMDATAGETAPHSSSHADTPKVATDAGTPTSLAGVEGDANRRIYSEPGKSADPKGSAAPSLASRLRTLNKEHPAYTVEQVAQALDETVSRVINNSNVHHIKWGSNKPRREGLGESIVHTHRANPAWPASRIAAALQCGVEYVRTTAQRNGLTLTTEREAKAASAPPAPTPAPAVKRLPVASATRLAPLSETVVTKPMVKPRGARFYLRDKDGLYLHFSCASMTPDKAHAWIGDERQLAGCRRSFSIAKDLREFVVEKKPTLVAA